MILRRLFVTYYRSILFTYFLTLLETLLRLISPWAIGVAIDGLLKKNYQGLVLLACIRIAYVITVVSRQVYDTRVFANIYSNLATIVVLEQNQKGVSTSQVIARSALSREFVSFFESDIPLVFQAFFGFIGALVMLYKYDFQNGLYSTTIIIPLLIINRVYVRKSIGFHRELNDRLEREVDVLTDSRSEKVYNHYQSLVKWRIKLSNAEAGNYGLVELFSIPLTILVLIRTIQLPGIQLGEIYAVLQYLGNYLGSLGTLPMLLQQFSHLKDIGDRVQLTSQELFTENDNFKDLR
jgi:ABC-type multidrug transport system fused ATPase/permease subunit